MTSVPFTTRVEFIVELARRLHEYGTAAPRLEAAVSLVGQRLSLSCDVLSTPTSIIMSFSQQGSSESGVAEMTQVLRLPPGEVNLKSLCLVDEIADKVINGDLDLGEGRRRLRAVGALQPVADVEDPHPGRLCRRAGLRRGDPADRLGRRGHGRGDRLRHRRDRPERAQATRTSLPRSRRFRPCWRPSSRPWSRSISCRSRCVRWSSPA